MTQIQSLCSYIPNGLGLGPSEIYKTISIKSAVYHKKFNCFHIFNKNEQKFIACIEYWDVLILIIYDPSVFMYYSLKPHD